MAPLPGVPTVPVKVDGEIKPASEYATGFEAPLQDWKLGLGDGALNVAMAGEQLFVGIRIHPGDCSSTGCAVGIFVDADRSVTLAHPETAPGAGDRAFYVYWTNASTPTVWQDSGTIQNVPYWSQWPAETRVSMQGDDMYHVELAITLRERLAPAADPRVLPTKSLGLAVAAAGYRRDAKGCSDYSFYVWPNEPSPTGGQWIALAPYPYTYATVTPRLPSDKPTGFLTYNTGMLPVMKNGGSGTPNDFAAVAMDPAVHVACLQELFELDSRHALVELATAMAELQGKPVYFEGEPRPCDGGSDEDCDVIVSDLEWEEEPGLLLLSRMPIGRSEEPTFGDDVVGCEDVDCMAEKGFIWAQVGTSQARRKACTREAPQNDYGSSGKTVCRDDICAGEDYIDVVCTHLQADCDNSTGNVYPCNRDNVPRVRLQQMMQIMAKLDAVRFPDRPAVLMGDLNVNGRSDEDLRDSNFEYGGMARVVAHTDQSSPWEYYTKGVYSARHDVGLGFHDAAPGVLPVRGNDPVYVYQAVQK